MHDEIKEIFFTSKEALIVRCKASSEKLPDGNPTLQLLDITAKTPSDVTGTHTASPTGSYSGSYVYTPRVSGLVKGKSYMFRLTYPSSGDTVEMPFVARDVP